MSLSNSNIYSSQNSSMYNNVSSIYPQTMQSNSKIAEIEAKMTMHEMEITKQNNILQDRIKQYIMTESDLKRELSQTATQLANSNEKLQSLLGENEYMKNQLYQTEEHLNKISIQYNILQGDYDKMYEDYTQLSGQNKVMKDQFNQLLYDNDGKDTQISTMSALIEKYANDIEELKSKLVITDKEKENYESMINIKEKNEMKMKNENEELKKENDKLKNEIENLNGKLKEHAEYINTIELQATNYQTENTNMGKMITKLQTQIEDLNELNQKLTKEKEELQNYKSSQEKNETNFSNEISKLKGELSNIKSITNDNIASITHWIENYFCTVYSPNVQLPEMSINNTINDHISFDKLKKTLIASKNKIDNELNDTMQKNKEMKGILTKGQDENYKMQKFIEDVYNYIQNEVEMGKYFNLNKNNFQYEKDYQKEIEENLNKIFSLLKRKKESTEENYANKLLEDNSLLNNELNELRIKFDSIYNENLSLDKKNKYLLQEIDMKKAQIKSQEEIINRRSNLEEDNKKLLKDNITLIKKLKKLNIKKEE